MPEESLPGPLSLAFLSLHPIYNEMVSVQYWVLVKYVPLTHDLGLT